MNTGLTAPIASAVKRTRASRQTSASATVARQRPSVTFRSATLEEAEALHALIASHVEEGHLLPRELAELSVHASRFVVAVKDGTRSQATQIVGCAELAPLSSRVAEVRSLVVDDMHRDLGIGRRLVEELQRRARLEGYETLCAFTHNAAYFVRMGFSIVPHVWVPEKIAHDCHSCALFRRCGQHAVVIPLGAPSAAAPKGTPLASAVRADRGSVVPLAALRG